MKNIKRFIILTCALCMLCSCSAKENHENTAAPDDNQTQTSASPETSPANGDNVGNDVDRVGDGVGDAVEGVGDGVGEAVEGVGDAVGGAVEGAGDAVGGAVEGVGDAAGGTTNGAANNQ